MRCMFDYNLLTGNYVSSFDRGDDNCNCWQKSSQFQCSKSGRGDSIARGPGGKKNSDLVLPKSRHTRLNY